MDMELDDGVPVVHIVHMIGGPLPGNWASDHGHTRPLGNRWLSENKSVALVLPSVVIPLEHNVLLNPAHPQFDGVATIDCKPFFFDPRLFTRWRDDLAPEACTAWQARRRGWGNNARGCD